MKIAAAEDDSPDVYSKTRQEADTLGESMSDEERRYYILHGGSRAVVLNGRLFSLCMTTDEHHGHQWHFSMTQIVGPNTRQTPDGADAKVVLDAFFSVWKEVPNPGQMVEVLHYVGNT